MAPVPAAGEDGGMYGRYTLKKSKAEIEALFRQSEDMSAQIAVMRRQRAEESPALDRMVAQESPDDLLRTSAQDEG